MNSEIKSEVASAPSKDEAVSPKEMILALIGAVILIAFCTAVWLHPLLFDTASPSGRGGRRILAMVNLVWNRPVASIAGAFGLLILVGTLFTRRKQKP